ncbi:MAG: hypothetical protein RL173_937 [Fibrobacterota bacterium]
MFMQNLVESDSLPARAGVLTSTSEELLSKTRNPSFFRRDQALRHLDGRVPGGKRVGDGFLLGEGWERYREFSNLVWADMRDGSFCLNTFHILLKPMRSNQAR